MWSVKNVLFVLLVTVVCVNKSVSLNILGVFALPGKSHYVIGEELLKTLAKKGHKVDVITHFPQKKPVPNYTDINVSGSMPLSVNNMSFQETQMINRGNFKFFLHQLGELPCDMLAHPELQKLLKKPKKSYDVIIVELFMAHCYLAFGQHFDAPVVGLVASKLHDWLYFPFGNSFNPSYVGSLMSSFSQEMTFFERLINTYIFNIVTYNFDYHVETQLYYVEKYFGLKLDSIQQLYNDVSIMLVNSHYSVGDIRPITPDIIDIGGLHVESESELTADLKKWLDESENGCVYISFGSMVKIESLPVDKLEAFYEMFRRIAPVRVLMKIADPKALPPNLPKNVKTSPWLPQIAVLKHKNTKAFVTHGGLMGTQESLAWAVALICVPLFGDQHSNCQTYERKKLAVTLDHATLNADVLTNAVKTVLNDPEYRKNVKEVAALFMDRPMSPKDTAVYWVEYAARYGNRLKSPATKLTWWQYYMLDVYGLIIGSLILVLYIIKRILGFIFGFICSRKTSTSMKSKKNK